MTKRRTSRNDVGSGQAGKTDFNSLLAHVNLLMTLCIVTQDAGCVAGALGLNIQDTLQRYQFTLLVQLETEVRRRFDLCLELMSRRIDLFTANDSHNDMILFTRPDISDLHDRKNGLFSPDKADDLVQVLDEEGLDAVSAAFERVGPQWSDCFGISHQVEECSTSFLKGLFHTFSCTTDADISVMVEIGVAHYRFKTSFIKCEVML